MAESLNGLHKTECYWRQESRTDIRQIELTASEWVAWYGGTLSERQDKSEDQRLRGTDGRFLRRDNDRDITPRILEHVG